jgi:hypothetical protein
MIEEEVLKANMFFGEDHKASVRCPYCGKVWRGGGVTCAQLSGRAIRCGNGLAGLGCGKNFRVARRAKTEER